MTVGMKITRRVTVGGRVYGVGHYPRGVPEDHAAELVRLGCGTMVPEQAAPVVVVPPAAAGGQPAVVTTAVDANNEAVLLSPDVSARDISDAVLASPVWNPKRLSKKSLAQRLRRDNARRIEATARQEREEALSRELASQPPEIVTAPPVVETTDDATTGDATVPTAPLTPVPSVAPTEAEIAAIKSLSGPIPTDLPGAAAYADGGIHDLTTLVNLPTDELLRVPGIDSATIISGREYILAMVRQPQQA